MPIFKRTFYQDLDLLEQHLTKDILSQADCKTILIKLRTTFENAFNSEFKERMQRYTRFEAQSFKDAMIYKMDSIRNDTDADDADIRLINEGQHGQILNETSNKAKIKKEINVLETMNIELEHSAAKLRKENETLKKH
uniref:Uncharacterized protein n=1 Tax=Tanacetum cinerariifolium TaxID=118510 RepID=A0A699HMR2_TANCI|nr:hypothetical protein [Tanacetum cinerariifolium]